MKSFWISLFVFILLMCSCKSKEVVTGYSNGLQVQSEVSYLNETVKVDTTATASAEQTKEIKLIFESITKTEYDTDKNAVKEVTKTERTFIQDSETDRAEEVRNYIETYSQDSLNHFADVNKMVESESETVTNGIGYDIVGRLVGVFIGIALLYLIYVLVDKKYRVS